MVLYTEPFITVLGELAPAERGYLAEACTHNPRDAYSPGRFLTNTVALISVQLKAEFTLAAEAQAVVICPVTQNTDLLTAPVVTSTWIAGWGKHTYYDTYTTIWGPHGGYNISHDSSLVSLTLHS